LYTVVVGGSLLSIVYLLLCGQLNIDMAMAKNKRRYLLWHTELQTLASLVVHVQLSALLKLFLKVTSTLSVMLASNVVHVQISAQ